VLSLKFSAFRLACTLVLIFHANAWQTLAADTVDKDQMDRGRKVYLASCLICHQLNGQGAPGVFPPLAGSDYLQGSVERAIRVVIEGLSGEITVNGKRYNNVMPPVVLDDTNTADVVTYVLNSWGNSLGPVTPEQVRAVRAKTKFTTYAAQLAANSYAPLPQAPAGFTLREAARLEANPVRLAAHPGGQWLYILTESMDIWRLEISNSVLKKIHSGKSFIDQHMGGAGGSSYGLGFDKERRLYLTFNQRLDSAAIITNRVRILRTTVTTEGELETFKPWFQASYPWGVGPFNHGVSHVAQGPDGFIYVASGSRTDGNEPGAGGQFWTGGEPAITCSIWRLDPKQEKPELEIFARGLRNPFGFCWNERGEMFATDNGPDADAPEELNRIEQGKHYGFPHQFSDWTKRPYAYTPDPPTNVTFTLPVINTGPSACLDGNPLSTFDAHSSPAGIVHLGADFPAAYRGSFFVVRFGNMIKRPQDAGFDLLQVRLLPGSEKTLKARITTVLSPLARPTDICQSGPGRLFICEYSQATNSVGSISQPGRILELSVKR
jgi:glucose/arabinose dehydrogenase